MNCLKVPNSECNVGEYYEPRIYMDTLQEATDFCISNEDCMGISRSNIGYEPRKHPLIAHHPNMFEFWYCIDGYNNLLN